MENKKTLHIIFVLLLIFSAATAKVYEAENMKIVNGSVVIASDSAMHFWSQGAIQFYCDQQGDLIFSIHAKQDYAAPEHAKLQVEAPGILDTVTISTNHFFTYSVNYHISTRDTIKLSFINDFTQEGDRNLHLDYVTILSMENTTQAIVSWDRNQEPDVAGYKVYVGTISRSYSIVQDAKNETIDTVKGLLFDHRYYFAATAYDTAGNESGFSNEIDTIFYENNGLIGDYNQDGIVDYSDLKELVKAFGATFGTDRYIEFFDFDTNEIIDYQDLQVFISHFGDIAN